MRRLISNIVILTLSLFFINACDKVDLSFLPDGAFGKKITKEEADTFRGGYNLYKDCYTHDCLIKNGAQFLAKNSSNEEIISKYKLDDNMLVVKYEKL